jgi:CheY-like chemotaxis protein
VLTAANGEQAVQMSSSFEADALVMDYGLPGMDGLRTYAEIVRRCGRQIDCVMITGDAAEGLAQHAIDQGVRHVLGKPFSFSELLRLLQYRAGAAAEDRSAQAA